MGHVALQRRLLATSTCLVAVAAACFPTLPPTPAELAAALTTLEHVLGPEPERAAGHVRVVQDVSAGDRLVLAAAGLALLYNRSLIDP